MKHLDHSTKLPSPMTSTGPGSPVRFDRAHIRSMRVLLLCHEYPPIGGGAAAVCAALAQEYAAGGAIPTVVTMGFQDLKQRETVDGIRVFRVPCGRKKKELASPLEGLLWSHRTYRLVRELRSHTSFDVTHAHFIMPAGIVAARLKKKFGIPFVVTPHGSDVPGYNRERLKLLHKVVKPWWRSICRYADAIASPSQSLLNLLEQHVDRIHSQVIPNGFVPGRFRPLIKEQRILLCSRLVERKGFQYLLAALREIDLPGWTVDIVGDGPARAMLEQHAKYSRTPVRFHGWIDNTDPRLADLYGRAMIFAFPSEWENFSIALLEGMSAGCAVIATNISGNPEVVGDTGYLVRSRDIEGLQRALLDLTSNSERCLMMGRAAAERAAKLFSWHHIGQQYLSLQQRLIAPTKASHTVPQLPSLRTETKNDQRSVA